MSWRRVVASCWFAGLLLHGAGCRTGGGGGGGDGDPDGGSDADGDFDPALCDEPRALGGECEPFGQLCCGRGERCALSPGGADGGLVETCVEATGSGGHGTPCAELGEGACAGATTCWPSPMIHLCVQLCRNSGDCPGSPPHSCDWLEGTASSYAVCVPGFTGCDPVAGTGCAEGSACVLVPVGRTAIATCFTEGLHAAGEDCGDGAGCRAGSGCYQVGETSWSCLEYCELTATCPGGQPCAELNTVHGVCPPAE